jgi:methionine-rich copper-binding protein CopC
MFLHQRLTIAARVIAVLGLLLMAGGVASAHAKLKSSVPAAGSTVASAPSRVVAAFDNHDALSADGSVLKVTDASGAQVDQGDTALDKSDPDRKTLAVSLKSGLGQGVYNVAWTAVSEGDGSSEDGQFSFTVGAASSASAAPTQLPTTGDGDALPVGLLLAGASLLATAGVLMRRRSRI